MRSLEPSQSTTALSIREDPSSTQGAKTYEQAARDAGVRYTVCDVPPLGTTLLLALQHILTMLGGTVLVPLLVSSKMGASTEATSLVISTVFVASGLNTLVQTTIGDRLPIIQGGSGIYLPAILSIIANPSIQGIADPDQRFLESMRVIQGAVITVGLLQMFIGYTGLFVPIIKFIGPLTIAPVISAVGLGLYAVAFSRIADCWAIGLTQLAATVLFSQFLKNVKICGQPIFAMFPIVLAIALSWGLDGVLTAANVWPEGSPCRIESISGLLNETPWFRAPYPLQWGTPRFEGYAIVPMIASMLASMIESIGNYYSCAKMVGAPPPTPGIIARGQAGEGWGVLVSGLFGTGGGTTSYAENIGAIAITQVGSRVVVQVAALMMIIIGVFTKLSAVLASIPVSIQGGLYAIVLGLIVAVGLANLQFVDMNSERNLFIVGFSIFNCLSIAGPGGYFETLGYNPFGDSNGGQIAYALFSSPMVVALITSFLLDNCIHGTREERGLHVWDQVRTADVNNDPEYVKVYSQPLFLAKIFHNCSYLEFTSLGRWPDPPMNGYIGGRGDIGDHLCPCFLRRAASGNDEVDSSSTVDSFA